MAVATQSVTTRLPEFQEQYIADLLTSAQNLFKPVSEGGKGLSMPFVQQQLAGLSEGQQQAITSALGGVGAYQPFLTESKEALTLAWSSAALPLVRAWTRTHTKNTWTRISMTWSSGHKTISVVKVRYKNSRRSRQLFCAWR